MAEYLNESAFTKSTRAVITARPDENVSEIEERIRKEVDSFEMLQYVYVLDEKEKLKGIVSIRDLFSYDGDVKAYDIMSDSLVWVSPESDQEAVAVKAVERKIRAMPVLGKDGTFIGVVTSDTILDILSEEHSEDLLHIGGIQKEYSASAILKDRLQVLLFARLPWLLVGLIGGIFAALAVKSFEGILEGYIILAFFLPLVVYMSDAVAGQTLTIFIRAMALDHTFSVKKYVMREMGLGLIIGLIVGSLLALVGFAWFNDPIFSLVLGVALFFSVIVAVLVALLMTIFLKSLNKDPAVGSGPFATILIDIVTIFIYFSVASFLLPGL
ncbi:MAG: magnesium transporter [Patescibacteria group bacterium]